MWLRELCEKNKKGIEKSGKLTKKELKSIDNITGEAHEYMTRVMEREMKKQNLKY